MTAMHASTDFSAFSSARSVATSESRLPRSNFSSFSSFSFARLREIDANTKNAQVCNPSARKLTEDTHDHTYSSERSADAWSTLDSSRSLVASRCFRSDTSSFSRSCIPEPVAQWTTEPRHARVTPRCNQHRPQNSPYIVCLYAVQLVR